jgi:CheY-like chemotaxis protein
MLTDDLMFFSRVSGAARAAGLVVRQARNSAALLEMAKREPPGGVILDLHNDGLDLPALLAALRDACPAMPNVTAYGSHVEAEVLRAARAAGCDRVLPRSQFVKVLEPELKDWIGG